MRGTGNLEHRVKWKSWCTGRSSEKNLKGKEFIEDRRKRSEIFGGTVGGRGQF